MIKNRPFPTKARLHQSLSDWEIENDDMDSSVTLEENPFEKVVQDYFSDADFFSKQSQITKDIQKAKKTLLEMDEADVAYQVMKEIRSKLESLYRDLKGKSEN